jgi:hypothetical protein
LNFAPTGGIFEPMTTVDALAESATGNQSTQSTAQPGAQEKLASSPTAGQQATGSPKQRSPYQPSNREANVVYHETAALRPVKGKSNLKDLHDARVDAAHVYNNLKNKSAFQDSGNLNSKEQRSLAGGYAPAVRAYNDSLSAVSEAAGQADTTHGSTHFFVRDVTAGDAQYVPSWANGNQIVFGPFKTAAPGDGPIHSGDTVYIWINNTR